MRRCGPNLFWSCDLGQVFYPAFILNSLFLLLKRGCVVSSLDNENIDNIDLLLLFLLSLPPPFSFGTSSLWLSKVENGVNPIPQMCLTPCSTQAQTDSSGVLCFLKFSSIPLIPTPFHPPHPTLRSIIQFNVHPLGDIWWLCGIHVLFIYKNGNLIQSYKSSSSFTHHVVFKICHVLYVNLLYCF